LQHDLFYLDNIIFLQAHAYKMT